jgi:hypothetical protein
MWRALIIIAGLAISTAAGAQADMACLADDERTALLQANREAFAEMGYTQEIAGWMAALKALDQQATEARRIYNACVAQYAAEGLDAQACEGDLRKAARASSQVVRLNARMQAEAAEARKKIEPIRKRFRPC